MKDKILNSLRSSHSENDIKEQTVNVYFKIIKLYLELLDTFNKNVIK